MDKIDRGRSKKLYKKRKQAWDLTPKDDSARMKVMIACVAVILLGVAVWLVPDISPKDPVVDADPTLPDNTVQTPVSSTIQQGDPKGKQYFKKALFIGDSLCVQLSGCSAFERAAFAANDRVNPENVTKLQVYPNGTLTDTLQKVKPDMVYIALGSNGASWMSVDQMVADIGVLIQKIREYDSDMLIYVMSAPQYGSDTASAYPNYDNEMIAAFNMGLKMAALEWKVYYLNSAEGLTAELQNGVLTYSSEDLAALEQYIATHTVK